MIDDERELQNKMETGGERLKMRSRGYPFP